MRVQPTIRTGLRKLAFVAAALGAVAPAHALVFNLTSTGNADADAGFQRAAFYWQGIFTDPVTVNVTTGFASLGQHILGQASSTPFFTYFATVKSALAGDVSSADDATFVGGLPAGDSYSKWINGTLDAPSDAHKHSGATQMKTTSADAKALGLLAANAAAEDAQITFSSNYAFDFDPSNGIDSGKIDFVGVAIHELGHAMGFISGIDFLDYYSPPRDAYHDVDFDPFTTVLDFTRCSKNSQDAGADMDWTIGTAAKSFAIDGNCTALVSDAWSTGLEHGDGYQASHWKDNRGLGIMDPTAAPAGSQMQVTALDIQALDVIGWDVPEPASLLLIGTGLMGMAAARRRSRSV